MQAKRQTLTGCVVESGHGVTHVIPVVDGFVIGSCIRTIPLAGRDITVFVQQALRSGHLHSLMPCVAQTTGDGGAMPHTQMFDPLIAAAHSLLNKKMKQIHIPI